MKRFAAYDPPEYLTWSPDPALNAEYVDVIERDVDRQAVLARLKTDQLLEIYRRLVRARLHDVTLKRWVRLGTISKAWLGTGEEAATVGPVFSLDPQSDFVAPMIRKVTKETGFNLKKIYELFPSGPAKGACKVAGLPKPTGCV